jgi:nucleotide-binding universal stress UspA family protein
MITTERVLVVGFDGTEPATRALEAAAELMRDRPGRIEVVFVAHIPPSAAYSAPAIVEVQSALDSTERTAAHQAGELLEGQGVKWHFQRRNGDVASELLAVADEYLASSGPEAKVAVVVGGSSRKIDRYLNSVGGRLIRRDRVRVIVIP